MPFRDVFDAATNVYPYYTEATRIDPRNIDCGDTVIVEGRVICGDAGVVGERGDMELTKIFLIEKGDTRELMRQWCGWSGLGKRARLADEGDREDAN